jgi:zinc protease
MVAATSSVAASEPLTVPWGPLAERRLPNGMSVLVQEDHRVPMVAVVLRYDVGNRAAPPGKTGIAGLTTSLMTTGTKHLRPGDYERWLASTGSGDFSSVTNSDASTFSVTVPAASLGRVLWLWSDQMGFFDGTFDDAVFRATRARQAQMHRTALEGSPYGRIDSFADAEIFPPDHPYRAAILGPPEEVDRIGPDDVIAFHDAWMTPEHAVLTVIGDVEARSVYALAERYFGSLSSKGSAHLQRPSPVVLRGEVQLDVAANVPIASVDIRWPTPRLLSVDDARLDVIAHMLSGSHEAWLYWDLVDTRHVATRVQVHQHSRDLGSEFEVFIEGAPGRSAAELLAAFDTSMGETTKRQADALGQNLAGLEEYGSRFTQIDDIGGRAQLAAKYEALVGTAGYFKDDVERYAVVTNALFHETMTRWLPTERRIVILVTPDPRAPSGGELRDRRFKAAVAP